MGSINRKLTLYVLVVSLVLLVLGIAVMKSNRGDHKATPPAQSVTATEPAAQPRGVARILERDEATREANREVAGDTSR